MNISSHRTNHDYCGSTHISPAVYAGISRLAVTGIEPYRARTGSLDNLLVKSVYTASWLAADTYLAMVFTFLIGPGIVLE
jgi:hypothetical protein